MNEIKVVREEMQETLETVKKELFQVQAENKELTDAYNDLNTELQATANDSSQQQLIGAFYTV